MRMVDSHFHWYPRAVFEQLFRERKGHPWARSNGKGGYSIVSRLGVAGIGPWAEFFDLDAEFAHMDTTGHQVDVICSIGPFSGQFSELPAQEGRDVATSWNEEMASAQRNHSGRFWGSAAVPLLDAKIAIEVLDHAVDKLGLVGVNIPGSVGRDERMDAERLEPFYDRVEQLGVPLFVHPNDDVLEDLLGDYDGALYLSLGRVIDVSVSGMRLVLSGIMERHPDLKVFISHTGGALPYQSGRMDKNSGAARLPQPPSTYLKRMYTDTVSPHTLGMKFAIEYYGADHVMYGSDYPCWSPAAALKLFGEIGLSSGDQEKIFGANARHVFGLRDTPKPRVQQDARDPARV